MIFIIFGKSGSGKDTIYKELFNKGLKLNKLITYTTRPMRVGETNGVEYNFITEDEYNKIDKANIIEERVYDVNVDDKHAKWRYLTLKNNIDIDNKDYICIGTIESFNKMKDSYGDKIIPLYITLDNNTRIDRLVSREEKAKKPNYRELFRRFVADEDDFGLFRVLSTKVENDAVFHNDNLDECVDNIMKYINKHMLNDVTDKELTKEIK